MLFFKRKLKNIFKIWIVEVSEFYKGLLLPIVSENRNISDTEYMDIYKKCINQYFQKATELIKNSNNVNAMLKWNILPLNPEICGIDVDYNNLNIGMIYAMVYYCFENKSVDIRDYNELNHINHDTFNNILMQLSNYYGG